MAGPENKLVAKIIKAVRGRESCWIRKIHGNVYTAGIPDLLCCQGGQFFAFEVKAPGKKCEGTPLQEAELAKIREAGGRGVVVNSVEAVVDLLDAALEGY